MGYAVLRWWPHASVEARVSGSRSAVLRKLQLTDRKAAFADFWPGFDMDGGSWKRGSGRGSPKRGRGIAAR
jgi:hypothetical protein